MILFLKLHHMQLMSVLLIMNDQWLYLLLKLIYHNPNNSLPRIMWLLLQLQLYKPYSKKSDIHFLIYTWKMGQIFCFTFFSDNTSSFSSSEE